MCHKKEFRYGHVLLSEMDSLSLSLLEYPKEKLLSITAVILHSLSGITISI